MIELPDDVDQRYRGRGPALGGEAGESLLSKRRRKLGAADEGLEDSFR